MLWQMLGSKWRLCWKIVKSCTLKMYRTIFFLCKFIFLLQLNCFCIAMPIKWLGMGTWNCIHSFHWSHTKTNYSSFLLKLLPREFLNCLLKSFPIRRMWMWFTYNNMVWESCIMPESRFACSSVCTSPYYMAGSILLFGVNVSI